MNCIRHQFSYMSRVPKIGDFLGTGRFYRRRDRNGLCEREFWEKGKAVSQLFTIMTFEHFFMCLWHVNSFFCYS